MIRIAQASSSETYSKFGTPPNQRRTGVTPEKPYGNLDGELNVAAYHSGFDRIFRCTDPKIADKAATLIENAVKNWKYVGYGQNWIDDKYPMCGLYDALLGMGNPDPLYVRQPVNCTCATLIGAGFYFAGVYEPRFRLLNTMEQEKILMSTGKFVKLTDPDLVQSGRGVRRGDILHRIGHTAIVLDDDPELLTVPYLTANCAFCNLRTGPGTEYSIIQALPNDTPVLWISSQNKWGQVDYNGKIGFISGKHLKPMPTATAAGDCWLRTEPKVRKDTEIIVIPKGAKPGVTGRTRTIGLTTWRECVYASKIGWASGKYIK